jgi:hypothetical protein
MGSLTEVDIGHIVHVLRRFGGDDAAIEAKSAAGEACLTRSPAPSARSPMNPAAV